MTSPGCLPYSRHLSVPRHASSATRAHLGSLAPTSPPSSRWLSSSAPAPCGKSSRPAMWAVTERLGAVANEAGYAVARVVSRSPRSQRGAAGGGLGPARRVTCDTHRAPPLDSFWPRPQATDHVELTSHPLGPPQAERAAHRRPVTGRRSITPSGSPRPASHLLAIGTARRAGPSRGPRRLLAGSLLAARPATRVTAMGRPPPCRPPAHTAHRLLRAAHSRAGGRPLPAAHPRAGGHLRPLRRPHSLLSHPHALPPPCWAARALGALARRRAGRGARWGHYSPSRPS